MDKMGVIYEVEGKKVLVLTPDGEFVVVKRQNHMLLGQQIRFSKQDIYRSKIWNNKYTTIASAVAAVFIAVLLFVSSFNSDDAYCYINVDINPSFELVLDNEYKVIKAVPINYEAKDVLDNVEIDEKHVKDVFLSLIKKSIDSELIKPESYDIMLVSAALNEKKEFNITGHEDEQKILDLMDSIDGLINQFDEEFNISAKMLRVTAKEREEALENNISMGRYNLYLKAKEIERDIELENVAAMNISELMEILNDEESLEESDSEKIPETGETPEPEDTIEPVRTPEPVYTPDSSVTTSPEPTSDVLPTTEPLPTMEPIQTPDSTPEEDTVIPTPEISRPDEIEELSGDSLKIQYYCENDTIETNTIDYSFRILNNGDDVVDLEDVKVRYYFEDNTDIPLGVYVYFFSHGDESEVYGEFYNLADRVNANRYLELKFSTGNIEPDEFVYVQGAIYKEDWSTFDQTNNYSFNPEAEDSYVDWERMTVYISDALVWGIEPN
ncbi:cellulose binding domain-containing protein [Herbivorax sp. ANBcel31]|uniref:anti-sigma-I factor RsgI family protein n=1 Tax=Herbivorax sp. ANBcel31 TaxID=3069754 RepID=UPI0027B5FC82|nr:cellulose binding domain-containing protein [Herbivorax sp. ANBcel31]MDQ2087570.1 cellulose binding domain-containing protein [Herbivorax sp. ANBcel31]